MDKLCFICLENLTNFEAENNELTLTECVLKFFSSPNIENNSIIITCSICYSSIENYKLIYENYQEIQKKLRVGDEIISKRILLGDNNIKKADNIIVEDKENCQIKTRFTEEEWKSSVFSKKRIKIVLKKLERNEIVDIIRVQNKINTKNTKIKKTKIKDAVNFEDDPNYYNILNKSRIISLMKNNETENILNNFGRPRRSVTKMINFKDMLDYENSKDPFQIEQE